MSDYRTENKNTIDKAIARFKKESFEAIKQGMCKLAEAGMEYLVEAHNRHDTAMMHPHENNTMAYVVAYKGAIVKSFSYNGNDDDLPGEAKEMAEALAAQSQEWVVILLSDMQSWYNYAYEVSFLTDSKDTIKANFHNYFKRVK